MLEGDAVWHELPRWLEARHAFWLDLDGPSQAEWEAVGQHFPFHPLSLEDARSLSEFARVEPYPDYLFVVLHRIGLGERPGDHRLRVGEVDLFIHPAYLVTTHLQPAPEIDEARRYLSTRPQALMRGSEFVAHLVVDAVVDAMFPAIERLVEQRERLEGRVLAQAERSPWPAVTHLRSSLLVARRSLGAQAEALGRLGRERMALVSPESALYFRDIATHADRLLAIVENELRLVDNLVQMYLAMRTDRLNVVMQRLTLLSALFMPLTLIAGIYGMNFRHMPELEWPLGYPLALALMAAVGGGLYGYLRRAGWFDADGGRRGRSPS
ncbi:magnesium/cobalt transporter CorA [Carboxydochorda subterranea]|uniref:Magnesium transport protein CorA n=1 Tax=Carboxydichorda subterranea TaxID=3109565 RepID=A0ABZ1BZP5_9FIRM|nr:magnesium/cobalt transporter CorA [Limnochorda sp. L945t]WRP18267.1 magnesium/cobalt transporter CorA [Limnochorda sp. L945t]